MSYNQPEYSKQEVLKNVKRSALGAFVIFITIVLPAEYNIDITWFGKLTGLTKLAQVDSDDTDLSEEVFFEENTRENMPDGNKLDITDVSVVKTETSEKNIKKITKTYTLGPRKDKEVKFKMNKGDTIDFTWQTTQTVYLDQHGEPTTSEGKEFLPFVSTKTGKYKKDSDSLTAQFTGTHGWYWRNLSNKTIQIQLTLEWEFEEK